MDGSPSRRSFSHSHSMRAPFTVSPPQPGASFLRHTHSRTHTHTGSPSYHSPGRSAPITMSTSFTPSMLSPTSSTAIRKLTEELDIVRKAWRDEGGELRAKMLEVHQAKIKSDERAFALESQMKMKELKFKEEIAKLHHEVRRHDVVADQIKQQGDKSAIELQSHVDQLSNEIARLRETIRVLDKRNRSLLLENDALVTARDMAVAQSLECDGANTEAQRQCRDLIGQLDTQRQQFEADYATISAEVVSLKRQASEEKDQRSAEHRKLQEQVFEADTRAAHSESEVSRLRGELIRTETRLGKEIEAERRRAVRAESDRDVLRSQLTQLKSMLQRSQGEFDTIASAVELICHE